MIKAGIIGATGYAGNEIARLLMGHKGVEVAWYGSRSYIEKNMQMSIRIFSAGRCKMYG